MFYRKNTVRELCKSLYYNIYGGEGEIRTLGGNKYHNGFRDRPVKPLRHLSVNKCFPLTYNINITDLSKIEKIFSGIIKLL